MEILHTIFVILQMVGAVALIIMLFYFNRYNNEKSEFFGDIVKVAERKHYLLEDEIEKLKIAVIAIAPSGSHNKPKPSAESIRDFFNESATTEPATNTSESKDDKTNGNARKR